MDQHDQGSYSDEICTPGKWQKDESGQMVDDLLLEVLNCKQQNDILHLTQKYTEERISTNNRNKDSQQSAENILIFCLRKLSFQPVLYFHV